MSYSDNIPFFINFYYIIFSIFSFPLNFALIYLIWVKSPSSFSTYRFLLLNTSVNETILIVFSFLLQMRIISAGESLALLPYGPLRLVSLDISFIFYNIYNLVLVTTNMSILVSMYYRYRLICHGKCKNGMLVLNFAVIWIGQMIMLAAILIPPYDFSTVILNTESAYPSYKLLESYGRFGGFKSTKNPIYVINTTILMGLPYLMPCLVLIWRYQIFKQINQVQTHLSEITKKASLDLVRALTLQAIVPMLCLIPNMFYFVIAQNVHLEFELAEFVQCPMCVIPCLIDPILTIIYVAPYRNFFTLKRKKVKLAQTVSVVPSTNRATI